MFRTMQYPFFRVFFEEIPPETMDRKCTIQHVPHEKEIFENLRNRIRELYNSADEIGEDDSDSTYTVKTGTAFPKISRVVFNEPVTKVWFEDGTTSMVRASKDDTFSKEAGLAFAIVKRLYGTPDDRGNYSSAGYMMELKRIIEKAYDQTPVTRKRDAEKATRRKAKEKAGADTGKISNGKPVRKTRSGRKRSR